jgi:hypothetical protein
MAPNYRDYVRAAYKSFEQPDFSFLRRVFHSRPYDPLIRKLRDFAAVEDLGECEDDVCFSYLLKGQNALWRLELSMVGPFAVFVRLRSHVRPGDFVSHQGKDLSGFEQKIVEKLNSLGIRLLTPRELVETIELQLFNTPRGKTCLYQALFSDRAELPWRMDDDQSLPGGRGACLDAQDDASSDGGQDGFECDEVELGRDQGARSRQIVAKTQSASAP